MRKLRSAIVLNGVFFKSHATRCSIKSAIGDWHSRGGNRQVCYLKFFQTIRNYILIRGVEEPVTKARREKRREYALILHLQSSLLNQAGRIFADRPHLAIALLEPEGIVPVLIEDYFP